MSIKLELNAQTGEAIVRELNAHEVAQFEIDKVKAKAQANAQTVRALARQAVLTKLGLSADEAQALFG